MLRHWSTLMVVALVSLCPTLAAAQPGGLRGNTTPYVQRSVTISKGMLRIDGGPVDFGLLSGERGFVLSKPLGVVVEIDPVTGDEVGGSSDVNVFFGTGAGFGITDKIEAGLVLFPIYFAPEADYGDISLYGRYKLLEGDTEIALQADMWLPTNTDFGLGFGAPIRFHLSPEMMFETGGRLRFTFGEQVSDSGDGTESKVYVALQIPAVFTFQVTDKVFIGGRSGINWSDLGESGTLAFPIGVQGGFSIADGHADLLAWFQWPYFLTPASDGDKVNAKFWELGFGASVWLDILGGT